MKRIFIKRDNLRIGAICATVAFPMVDGLVNRVLMVEFWDSFIIKGLYYTLIFIAILLTLPRVNKGMLLFPLCVVGLFMVSSLFFKENRASLAPDLVIPLILIYLPLYIMMLSVNDGELLIKSLRMTSIIVMFCAFIYIWMHSKRIYSLQYMEFSYNLSLSVMLLFIIAVTYERKMDFILSIVGILILFVMGARGAFLGVLLGVVFIVFRNFKPTLNKIIRLALAVGVVILISANTTFLLNELDKSLESLNISSRTIDLLLASDVGNESGRDVYRLESFDAIRNNLFLGLGMAGDRYILGTYSHNLLLELLISYGAIIGTVLIGLLFYYSIGALKNNNVDGFYIFFVAVFFTNGFVKLQFSSSYLLEPMFFIMIALAVKIIKKHKYVSACTSIQQE